MGIDYGMGRTNIDHATGIRYGVIHLNDTAYGWEECEVSGTDLDYQEWRENGINAILSAMSDYGIDRDMAENAFDDMDLPYESDGCIRYEVETDDYHLQTDSYGDCFILRSKWVALRDFCSPCAPGACHLQTDGNVPCYCLGPELFDDDCPMPYQAIPLAEFLASRPQ